MVLSFVFGVEKISVLRCLGKMIGGGIVAWFLTMRTRMTNDAKSFDEKKDAEIFDGRDGASVFLGARSNRGDDRGSSVAENRRFGRGGEFAGFGRFC